MKRSKIVFIALGCIIAAAALILAPAEAVAAVRAGETIRLSAGRQGNTFYVQGDGPEEKARFDAAVTLSPLDNPQPGA